MKRRTKAKAIVITSAIIFVILLGLFFKWWVLWVLFPVCFFYASRYLAKRYYTRLRNNANFRTIQGDAIIKMCNKNLDILNGRMGALKQ